MRGLLLSPASQHRPARWGTAAPANRWIWRRANRPVLIADSSPLGVAPVPISRSAEPWGGCRPFPLPDGCFVRSPGTHVHALVDWWLEPTPFLLLLHMSARYINFHQQTLWAAWTPRTETFTCAPCLLTTPSMQTPLIPALLYGNNVQRVPETYRAISWP